jgi:hypothetical protein
MGHAAEEPRVSEEPGAAEEPRVAEQQHVYGEISVSEETFTYGAPSALAPDDEIARRMNALAPRTVAPAEPDPHALLAAMAPVETDQPLSLADELFEAAAKLDDVTVPEHDPASDILNALGATALPVVSEPPSTIEAVPERAHVAPVTARETPHVSEAAEAVRVPKATQTPEPRVAAVAAATPVRIPNPPTPIGAKPASTSNLSPRDREILGELEAWLIALKR